MATLTFNGLTGLTSSIDVSPQLSSNRTSIKSPTIWKLCYYPSLQLQCVPCLSSLRKSKAAVRASATMSSRTVQEILPPALTSSSDPPQILDGTTRLYISYTCPYAQRVWITRNCKEIMMRFFCHLIFVMFSSIFKAKGLQEKITLVPIDLKDRPDWYKEKVYSANKVPALEHNKEVKGESLDLIKYIDGNFAGPSLSPDDPAKKEFAEELFSYTDSFNKAIRSTLKGDADEAGTAFDYLETALSKFDDGPFFLGQFSLVDIAYAPFIERFQPTLLDFKNYDITAGRPKLAAWIEEMDRNEAYNQTKRDPKQHVESYRQRFAAAL
ncbi:Glutathione S-transferase L2, chloroplastic [Turnera subulata]|uniref:Glutathione S-transferase L2, chloroplastic n=1 Tax=Turnera subulata TaxID=218843 RepID=A0A9Q0J026_9ROSI|nr:Glutathione S-transferase L2, chloroplastic [Turnera subulata]